MCIEATEKDKKNATKSIVFVVSLQVHPELLNDIMTFRREEVKGYYFNIDEFVNNVAKAVIARGPSPSLRAEGEAISFLARDKLRNLAVAHTH